MGSIEYDSYGVYVNTVVFLAVLWYNYTYNTAVGTESIA